VLAFKEARCYTSSIEQAFTESTDAQQLTGGGNQMNGLTQAQHIFDRRLPTDSERPNMDADDVAFDKRCKFFESYLRKLVMTDAKMIASRISLTVAEDVFDRIAGAMTTAECVKLGRAVLLEDKDAVFNIVKALTDSAIKQAAESYAEED